MTPEQYGEAKFALGLSHARLARVLKMHRRTSTRYLSGARKVPAGVAQRIRLMLSGRLKPEELENPHG